jgi:hypothetical protein
MVTLKLQVAVPQPSVAVQVTGVLPVTNDAPEGGSQATVRPAFPVAVGAYVTIALHVPGAPGCTISEGQVRLSGWQSLTVILNEQLLWLLAVSVAVQLTVVAPTGKLEPDAGEQISCTVPQAVEALAM